MDPSCSLSRDAEMMRLDAETDPNAAGPQLPRGGTGSPWARPDEEGFAGTSTSRNRMKGLHRALEDGSLGRRDTAVAKTTPLASHP